MARPYHKHGLTNTRLYRAWQHMKDRCNNPAAKNYKDYGGRGITLCQEWMDFETFAEWAFSHGYADDLSIERIDNDSGYRPDNCKWATWKEQRANQRQRKSKSGIVGVRDLGPNYFVAYACEGRKYHYLGRFETAAEAVRARAEYIERHKNGAV